MVSRIYLLRHGEIKNANEKRYIGITDVDLSLNGIKQVEKLRDKFMDEHIDYVFSSNLKRSIKTAETIAKPKNKPVNIIKDFREINMGIWENQIIDQVKIKYKMEYEKRGKDFLNYKTPKGESFLECKQRAIKALDFINSEYNGNIIIVGHAGINRLIISSILDIRIQDMFKIKQDYGCYNIIDCYKNRYMIKEKDVNINLI
ncbi:MAG: histidine phosphatase family protein [Clostridiaceae bacterium]